MNAKINELEKLASSSYSSSSVGIEICDLLSLLEIVKAADYFCRNTTEDFRGGINHVALDVLKMKIREISLN